MVEQLAKQPLDQRKGLIPKLLADEITRIEQTEVEAGLSGLVENLTPGQGTLLGGLAVLVAGIAAFSTGWFDRRAEQRRFHYEEMKQVYIDAIKYSMSLHITACQGRVLRNYATRC